MKQIYFDNAATTKPYDEVVEVVSKTMKDNFANPSSLHRLGMNAEKIVKNAREKLAGILCVLPKEIYFTAGGTESDNLAILGYVRANKKRFKKIVTTQIEHHAVLEPFHALSTEDIDVDFLPVTQDGILDLDVFANSLTVDTGLVSVMSVNNETGAMQPIESLKAIMSSICPNALLHVDHVQGFSKVPLNIKTSGIDMLSISGHKIHGPKGIGALYIRDKINIQPIIYGGHQEKNIRSGTHSVYDIAGFAKAAEIAFTGNLEKNAHVLSLNHAMRVFIEENITDIRINSPETTAPHILNVSFYGLRSEILLHSLEAQGIYVSTGSACASNRPELSHTLLAMGLNAKSIDCAIRFSFSEINSREELEFACGVLKKEVETLRKYIRR